MDVNSWMNMLAAAIAALASNLLVSLFDKRNKFGKQRLVDITLQYGLIFAALVAAVALAIKSGILQRLAEGVVEGAVGARLFATGVLMSIGLALYWLREKERRLYALLELAVAAVTAYSSLQHIATWHQATSWVPIAGAVYLVVRGLDNLMQGIAAARKEADGALGM